MSDDNNEIDAQLAQLKHDQRIKDYMLIDKQWYIIDFNSPEYIAVDIFFHEGKLMLKKK